MSQNEREATTAMSGTTVGRKPPDGSSFIGAAVCGMVLLTLLVLAAGCGRPATGRHEATLLPEGRIEWKAEGSRLIKVPRGLAVTRTVRLTNRTGRSLENVSARTSCPSCSSARVESPVVPDGDTCTVEVTVSMPGPSYEGDRRIQLFVATDAEGASATEYRTLEIATRDSINKVMDLVDRPASFEASWHEARDLRLHWQVWYGSAVERDSIHVSSPAANLEVAVVPADGKERVIELEAELGSLPAGDVNTAIVITARGAIEGDDATLAIPIRGWIGARYAASPKFIHLGTMPLEAAKRATRTVTVTPADSRDRAEIPRAATVRGAWTIVSVTPDVAGGFGVEVAPAPTAAGECIDTLRVGSDSRDWLDIRLEVDVEGEEVGQSGRS